MFTNYSMTATGAIVLALGYILKWAGVPFVEGDVEKVVDAIVQLVGWVGIVWGQIRRKDLRFGFLRLNSVL